MDFNEFPLQNRRILITGGTGSLGKFLVRRILSGELGTPSKVIVFSRDEAKQHQMRVDYLHKNKAVTDEVIYRNFVNLLEFRIGDVSRFEDISSAMRDADVVINAAALKQVPVCEYFPGQAVLTNCIGASNIVRAIEQLRMPVDTVVGVSTDKACKPVNVMGMSKALQERIFIAGNVLNPKTRFLCVRYGNVLASRGSVIPLFHEQINNGGPLTITDNRMTRFLLSLDEAVDTVFAAIRHGRKGEIFVPQAPAAKMTDIAQVLMGKKNLEIKITGIRPGEKLHEVLVSEEEIGRTHKRAGFFVVSPMLPELELEPLPENLSLKRELSSEFDLLDLQGVQGLLTRHKLLEPSGNENLELLR